MVRTPVDITGATGTVTGPVSLSRALLRIAFYTSLAIVIYLWLGVAPLVVFLTVAVSLSGFLAAVYLLRRRFGVLTDRGLLTAVSIYFANLAIQRISAEALLTGDTWAAATAMLNMTLLAFYMPYHLAKFWIREDTQRHERCSAPASNAGSSSSQ